MNIDIKNDEDGFYTQIEISHEGKKLNLEYIITDEEYKVKLNGEKVQDKAKYVKIIRNIQKEHDKIVEEIYKIFDVDE